MSTVAAMYKSTDKYETILYKENSAEDDRSSSQSSPTAMLESSSSTMGSEVSPASVEENKNHDSSFEEEEPVDHHHPTENGDSPNLKDVGKSFNDLMTEENYDYSTDKNGNEQHHKGVAESTSSSSTCDRQHIDVEQYEIKLNDTVHQNMLLLMKSSLFADTIVLVGGHRFSAHRVVLSASSGYFYKKFLLSGDVGNFKNLPLVIDISNSVTASGFEVILRCIYTTKLNLSGADINEVFEAAEVLEIPSLISLCRAHIKSGRPQSSNCDVNNENHNAIDLRVVRKSPEMHEEETHEKEQNSLSNNISPDNLVHLKKYHNFLQHRRLLNPENDKGEFYQRDPSKGNIERGPTQVHQSDSNIFQNNLSAAQREQTVPQFIAPFTMARAAVLAMASQFPRFSNIAAPTPLLPFPGGLQSNLYRPFAESPFSRSHALPNIQNDGTGLADKIQSTNRNLLLELSNKRASANGSKQQTTNNNLAEEYSNELKRQKTPSKSSASKPYKCLVCSAEFNRPANLKTHMRIHSGEKPYRCDACGARFVQVAHLRAHALIHTGEKPYQCKICGTRFRHLQTLKSHIRIHTGEKPYSCAECKVQFRHKSQLRLHLRTKHGINTNTKKSYEHVPGLRSDHISAHIKRTQEMIRVNHQMNRTLKNDSMQ